MIVCLLFFLIFHFYEPAPFSRVRLQYKGKYCLKQNKSSTKIDDLSQINPILKTKYSNSERLPLQNEYLVSENDLYRILLVQIYGLYTYKILLFDYKPTSLDR
ncbi:MAG: hypothetical protein JJT94_15165 [Bernardetiaceae bacterium]|nr:hypothetical protein [Bernardetiaceae bacterium]